ncbi:uncharacterized protein LOC134282909 [Saccostrea cucullata]|uniref:uncharacterized protein LOC134282909 n=1 Tax=Saccostrea cuccullata TaxID=36930 RepID=UPI002ED04B9A
MKMELSFLLTILLWIYQVSTDNHFSVQTTCTPPSNRRNEIDISCTVCGFSVLDFFNFEVEWHLQKNQSIISPAKITPGNLEGNDTKYTWEFMLNDVDCEGNKTVFKLVDQKPTFTSLGIYTCYVTLNGSTTKQSSVDLSSGNENASPNYVLMRVSNVPVADIAKSCKKYGYDVFMDDSVAKSLLSAF